MVIEIEDYVLGAPESSLSKNMLSIEEYWEISHTALQRLPNPKKNEPNQLNVHHSMIEKESQIAWARGAFTGRASIYIQRSANDFASIHQ